jgi:hypothetical protein
MDAAALSGPAECLDKASGGYCTHECAADTDCCAIAGECRTTLKQVCAPFESTGKKYCFLSCEDADLRPPADAGADASSPVDPNEYCRREALESFACRSTGGGNQNRKVCWPGGGTPSDAANDTSGSGGVAGAGGTAGLDAAGG